MAQLTPKQAMERSTEWLGSEGGMTVAEDGGITIAGDPPLAIALATDDEKVVVTHVREEPGANAGRADAVMSAIPDRGTLLHVSAAVTKTGVTFTFTNPVYLDGFSRHALLVAVNELVATIDRIAGGPAAPTRVHAPVSVASDPAPAKAPAASEPVATDTTDTAEVDPVAAGWSATHRVPAGGVRAWDEPDPAAQPTSRLEARVELQVAERRGDWARVVGSNGWTGWVDARKLEDVGPASSGGGRIELGGFSLRPLPLIAVVGLVLAAVLPWVDVLGNTANSFEVALSFLWDLTAAGSPYLGVVVIALAVLALFVAGASKSNPALATLLGVASVAIATLFVVQMYRGVADGGGSFGDMMDILGTAPWAMLASGVVLLAAARK